MLNISKKNPIAENIEKYSTVKNLANRPHYQILNKIIIYVSLIGIVILFLPWTQNISGSGAVTTLKPDQRPQTIHSAIGGRIEKWFVKEGDYVKKGDVIAVIADENKVEGVLNVDENSIGKVKIGQTVFVQLNTNKNEVYNAKVSEILAAFDEQTQSFICKVIFDKPLNTSLYGTQLEANILVGEKKNALLIPRNFLGFGNKVMVKGKDEAIIVKTGIVSTEYVEILDGITKEDVLLPLKP